MHAFHALSYFVMIWCVSNLTIIVSDNDLSLGGGQAIIWTNVGILSIRNFGEKCSEILGKIQTFSFTEMHLKMSSVKSRPFRLGPNMLKWSQCQGNIPEKIWMIYYTNQLKTRNIIKTNKTQYISEYISAIRHITRTIWTESKIKKNVYRSDVQVTIELHGNFRFLQVFKFQIKLHLESIVLLSGFQRSPGALKSTELGSTWSISQVWRA